MAALKKNKSTASVPEIQPKKDKMFENSDIEHSDAKDSDSGNEEYYEQDDPESRKEKHAAEEVNTYNLENTDDGHFLAWERNQTPVIQARQFIGISAPKHTLEPASAVHFHYFCLFIPVYFVVKIATYTNAKAGIESHLRRKESVRLEANMWWRDQSMMYIVMWWCLSKGLTFEQFLFLWLFCFTIEKKCVLFICLANIALTYSWN